MGDKYAPLGQHLRTTESVNGAIRMTFEAIARLVGGLPPSAYRHPQWWANNHHSQASAWTGAEFRVGEVDLRGQWVTFCATGGQKALKRTGSSTPRRATVDLPALDEVAVAVHFTWRALGGVRLDAGGKLQFPNPPAAPGLYRITLTQRALQQRPRVYIGESQDLRNRMMSNYRNPGPGQQTSLRINALLTEHLAGGGQVDVAVALSGNGRLSHDGVVTPFDLTRKPDRLIAENAALITLRAADDANIVNLG